jgi:hypothetical protein
VASISASVMQDARGEWLGAVRQSSSNNFAPLSFSSATRRQLAANLWSEESCLRNSGRLLVEFPQSRTGLRSETVSTVSRIVLAELRYRALYDNERGFYRMLEYPTQVPND